MTGNEYPDYIAENKRWLLEIGPNEARSHPFKLISWQFGHLQYGCSFKTRAEAEEIYALELERIPHSAHVCLYEANHRTRRWDLLRVELVLREDPEKETQP